MYFCYGKAEFSYLCRNQDLIRNLLYYIILHYNKNRTDVECCYNSKFSIFIYFNIYLYLFGENQDFFQES